MTQSFLVFTSSRNASDSQFDKRNASSRSSIRICRSILFFSFLAVWIPSDEESRI